MDLNNTGAMRSPFSPRVRQTLSGRRPLGLGSGKKNQSMYNQPVEEQGGDIIYKTPLITLETYGSPLPVMVTEALTFASGDVSVRMSPCGWCWLVHGRRVLTWPCATAADSPAPTAGPSAARELTLPQTDLAHKADLVILFYEEDAPMPSCIGVSPEGVVRYWASVGQEGAYVDVSCELAGQECDRIASARSNKPLVLATTTCTLVLLTPATVEGRLTVTCRTLRPPSGWLGGIGRRVSLLFFGSMPAHAETKLVGVVVLGQGGLTPGASGCVALVADGAAVGGSGGAGPVLQVWRGAELHEHSLRRALCEAHARPHISPHGDWNSLEICALEVRASSDAGLLLLVAAVNAARDPQPRYAIAHISLEDLASPRVTSLLALRSWALAADAAPAPVAPRFLPLATHVLLYTSNYIALVSSGGGAGGATGAAAEVVDAGAEGDRILGGEVCGAALLFSARHGVLRLAAHVHAPGRSPPATRRGRLVDTADRSMCDSPMGSPCPADMYDGNLSLYEIDPHEISAVTTDACGKLKTAFLFHLRREAAPCRDLVHALFPAPPPAPPSDEDLDHVLDRTVLTIATEMLDDMPAGDPRWKAGAGAAARVALGSSAALQVAAQLQDKKRAFTLFLDFLRATGLWHRLARITTGGCVMSTEAALCSLDCALAASIALRNLQQGADAHLIDAAIYQVVCGGTHGGEGEGDAGVEEEPEVAAALESGALSASDAFYRRVSRSRRALHALCARRPHAAAPATQRRNHLAATLNILNCVVSEMASRRARWSAAPPPSRPLLAALKDLVTRAVAECAPGGGGGGADGNLAAQVLEGAGALAGAVLEDAAPLRDSDQTAHLYNNMRRDLIAPFVAAGQTERAAALAEKFKDLSLLIEMCVEAEDLERLYSYIDTYIDEGMCELACAWLGDRGGRRHVQLTRELGERYPARLAAWLRAGEPARRSLACARALHARDHRAAAELLLRLAEDEVCRADRMTTMASLAKLCLVAAEPTDREASLWEQAENLLTLGEQHNSLPQEIRRQHGLDDDMPVHRPEDLVQMYVECESPCLTEYDYKKALDLAELVPDQERRDELRLQVWCACVLRDEWAACDMEAPLRALHTKMFFRLLDLIHTMGGDVERVLPPLETLTGAAALADLADDPRFLFMIKFAYECLDTRTHLAPNME